MQQLKHQIIQITLVSFVWLLVLVSLFWGNPTVQLTYIWKLLAIAFIIGGVFGGIYPYVWQFLTWSALLNSIVMTGVNLVASFTSLYLFSTELFQFIFPYWWGVVLLTLGIHIIVYQLYRKYETKKIAHQLNQLTK